MDKSTMALIDAWGDRVQRELTGFLRERWETAPVPGDHNVALLLSALVAEVSRLAAVYVGNETDEPPESIFARIDSVLILRTVMDALRAQVVADGGVWRPARLAPKSDA